MEHRKPWAYPRDARRTGPRSMRGFSFVELLTAMVILSILTALAVPAYNRMRSRFYDATALSDVVNVAKSVEGLDNKVTFSQTVRGPGRFTRLPGSRVSKDVTLLVQRRLSRGQLTYLVRGNHRRGSGATYFCQNGRVYATGARLP